MHEPPEDVGLVGGPGVGWSGGGAALTFVFEQFCKMLLARLVCRVPSPRAACRVRGIKLAKAVYRSIHTQPAINDLDRLKSAGKGVFNCRLFLELEC